MKLLGEFIKSTLLGGLLVILPLCLGVMVVLRVVGALAKVVAPIVERLPDGLRFHNLAAALILLLACFATGLLARTRVGKSVGRWFESRVLEHIPGYSIVRTVTRRIGNVEEGDQFAPAFAEIEEALVPAFVVEEHADGRYTVFVPSAPTPAVGAVYVMARERVHLVDAPFLKSVQCVTKWGAGCKELVRVMRAPGTAVTPVDPPELDRRP